MRRLAASTALLALLGACREGAGNGAAITEGDAGPDAASSDASSILDAGAAEDAPSAEGGPTTDAAAVFDAAALRALLAANKPGAAHEALPHGVPSSYDWYAVSRADPSRSDPRLSRLNWWGQVFTDSTGLRAANTRVAVREGVVLLLFEGESTWQIGQRENALAGGSWSEDFQTYPCGSFDMRVEADTSRSFVPDTDCAAHFWPDVAHVDIGARALRAVVAVAHARLVLAEPSGPDDRASSRYLLGLGVDWRDPVGGCPPNDAGVPICSGAGVGRMVLPSAAWRAVVFSTMTDADLASLPLPPLAFFRHPDGTWPAK
ncbi:MAG: hypothetical protein JST00_00530 [Deltaproteobacteria bacterium]|nr:hypothetical protein [Deltaproteobacteria bacterium]